MIPNISNEIIKKLKALQSGNCIVFGTAFKVAVFKKFGHLIKKLHAIINNLNTKWKYLHLNEKI